VLAKLAQESWVVNQTLDPWVNLLE
jgi:hypothetical protein